MHVVVDACCCRTSCGYIYTIAINHRVLDGLHCMLCMYVSVVRGPSVPINLPESPVPLQICLHWLCVPVSCPQQAVAFADVEEELAFGMFDPANRRKTEKSDGNAEVCACRLPERAI